MRQRPVMAVACAVSAVALVAGVVACDVESTSSTTATVSSSSEYVPVPAPTGPETTEFSQIASVVRIVPMSGPPGSYVTITGTDFVGARAICFGAFPSPRFQISASGSQITAVVPAGSGTVQVTVVKTSAFPRFTCPVTLGYPAASAVPPWRAGWRRPRRPGRPARRRPRSRHRERGSRAGGG